MATLLAPSSTKPGGRRGTRVWGFGGTGRRLALVGLMTCLLLALNVILDYQYQGEGSSWWVSDPGGATRAQPSSLFDLKALEKDRHQPGTSPESFGHQEEVRRKPEDGPPPPLDKTFLLPPPDAKALLPYIDKIKEEQKEEERSMVSTTGTKADRPFRTEEDMARSQACLREGQGYLYLLHMRKAGGSSMRRYLYTLTRTKPDYHLYITEGSAFNVSCFHDQGEMVMLTTMRHPISRIVSSYWYEGVNGFGRARRKAGKGSNTTTTSASTSKDAGVVSLAQWVQDIRSNIPISERKQKRVWLSVENYYIKTLINRYRDDPLAPITQADFELAKRVLFSFDAIVITEWMRWENTTAYINSLVGGKPSLSFPSRNINKVRPTDTTKESLIDPATLQSLDRLNYWDLQLYEYAKQLMTSRLQAFLQQPPTSSRVKGSASGLQCREPVLNPKWDLVVNKGADGTISGNLTHVNRPQCMFLGWT